jgi:hypothetical protein
MVVSKKLRAIEVALIACFTALYVVLAFSPMFQVIGFFGKTITAASVIAPVIGIILGPYLGVLSTLLGGIASLSFSPFFFPPSLVAGVVTAVCAGLLYKGKRIFCILIYLILLLCFGFYPTIGPFWIYPAMTWFQVIGFLVLISPLQSMAIKNITSHNPAKFLSCFFVVCLTSTLAGQIAGSLAFELSSSTVIAPDLNAWRFTWQVLTFQYPLERVTMAIIGALVGAPLLRVLRSANLTQVISPESSREEFP